MEQLDSTINHGSRGILKVIVFCFIHLDGDDVTQNCPPQITITTESKPDGEKKKQITKGRSRGNEERRKAKLRRWAGVT